MALVAIRLDDVHGGTGVELLRALDEQAFGGRPFTVGVIPYPTGDVLDTGTISRNSLTNSQLRAYLDEGAARGSIEVSVHGLTHADHRAPGGSAVAELVAPSQPRVDWLLRVLHRVRDEFGTTTLIPPHNFIDRPVAGRVLAAGFHISRALMDSDVAAVGLVPGAPAARVEAKRRCPGRVVGNAVEVFQTVALWSSGRRNGFADAKTLAARTMDVISPSGVGVVTLHWWDFLRRNGTLNHDFVDFVTAYLGECSRRGDFTTLSSVAEYLQRRPVPDRS